MFKINYYIFFLIFLFIILIIIFNFKFKYIIPNKFEYDFNPIINFYDTIEFFKLLNHENKLLLSQKQIIKYMPARNLFLIKNKYEIIKEMFDYSDLHIVLYYQTSNSFKLIIRRLDDYKINSNFKIKIFDIDYKKYDIINIIIDKNDTNFIEAIYDTKIILYKNDTNTKLTKIPKKIIQTSKDRNITNAGYNAIMTFIDLNPHYEYHHYNDNEIINYISTNFDDNILKAYNKLIPGAYKADLFRACVLYKEGGCYFDIKQVARMSIDNIINSSDNLILCEDAKNNAYYNALMIAEQENDIIKKYLDAIVYNIENNYYGNCPLCPTGPCLLYNISSKYNKPDLKNTCYSAYYKIRHKGNIYKQSDKSIFCNTSYLGYYKKDDKEYYSNLWDDKKIYK